MITNSRVKSILDTFENSIDSQDKCINELKKIMKNKRVELPRYLEDEIISIDKYDSLELIVKTSRIIELANTLAKSTEDEKLKKHFYSIKLKGITFLSKADNLQEIDESGSGYDFEKKMPNYTISISRYGKKAVISWHVATKGPTYKHLTDLLDPNYKEYTGDKITDYNPRDIVLEELMNYKHRYNEKGMIELNEILTQRGEKKELIKGIIHENFPKLELDKILNGEVLKAEEKIYDKGGFSGVGVIESIIRAKIKENYKEDTSKAVESKFNKLHDKFKSDNEEEDAKTFYLISKIMDTVDFESEDFDKVLDEIKVKVEITSKIHEKTERLDERGEKYEMMSYLESSGIGDIGEIIRILNAEEDPNEKTKSEITLGDIMGLVKEANCTETQILEAVNYLLEYVCEKGKTRRIEGNPLMKAMDLATNNLSSRGILELRRKMEKGEFIGGGKY